MVVFLIGITTALGFVALGLGLFVLSTPVASAPGGLSGPGLSNNAP